MDQFSDTAEWELNKPNRTLEEIESSIAARKHGGVGVGRDLAEINSHGRIPSTDKNIAEYGLRRWHFPEGYIRRAMEAAEIVELLVKDLLVRGEKPATINKCMRWGNIKAVLALGTSLEEQRCLVYLYACSRDGNTRPSKRRVDTCAYLFHSIANGSTRKPKSLPELALWTIESAVRRLHVRSINPDVAADIVLEGLRKLRSSQLSAAPDKATPRGENNKI